MKFARFFLVGMMAFLTFVANAQSENSECERMKFQALEAISYDDFATAASYLLKAEKKCDNLNLDDRERLSRSLIDVIEEETEDKDRRQKYIDTLLKVWDRQETKKVYNETDDLKRAFYVIQAKNPELEKADSMFQKGIRDKGAEINEAYLVYASYAAYRIYEDSEGKKKATFKTRMLLDYFYYSHIMDNSYNTISPHIQRTLDGYLEHVFPSCQELLQEVQGYIDSLPKDTVMATKVVKQMTELLEDKGCSKSNEYVNLVDAWLSLDPNSIQAKYKKTSELENTDAIRLIHEIQTQTNDPELKAELQYKMAYLQYKAGEYRAAYSSGLACTGKYKSKGLLIASQSVAATANSCGSSTFERKCNYNYAAQLALQAGQKHIAAGYRAKGFSKDASHGFDDGLVELSCWGVTVNLYE